MSYYLKELIYLIILIQFKLDFNNEIRQLFYSWFLHK